MNNSNRLDDLIRTAEKRGVAHTKLLTPAEAQDLRQQFGTHQKTVCLEFISGFEEAERSVAVLVNAEWGEYKPDEIIAAIKITHRKQDDISHRDILGSVLALGVTRESIGDIVSGDFSYLVCLKGIAPFIADNLVKIGRYGVESEVILLKELPKITKQLQERSGTVASLRFDCIVSEVFNISRGLAAAHIIAGKAQLQHALCEKLDKEVNAGDIISVRGLGRVKLLEIGSVSRKGRIWIKYGRYV